MLLALLTLFFDLALCVMDLVNSLLLVSFEFYFIIKFIGLLVSPKPGVLFSKILFLVYCWSWPSVLISGDVSHGREVYLASRILSHLCDIYL